MRQADGTFRKLRHSGHEPGQSHELTFTCHHRLPLLSKDRSRRWLVEAMERTRLRHQVDLWAYVIMPEHVHILLRPREPNADMAAILKSIKQPVARAALSYLRRHAPDWLGRLKATWSNGQTRYHFWQPGGGYDRNIDNPWVAWASVEYIHANPVRRGLAVHPADWPWSSAGWYAGARDVVLAMDGRPPEPS